MSVELNRYLGDAVYAEYDPCSGNLILRSGSHLPEEATNVIVLEPDVMKALENYVRQLSEIEAQAAREAFEENK